MAAQDDTNVLMDNLFQIDGDDNSLIQKSLYYDIDEFNIVMKTHNVGNNLSVLNLNARSLVKHFNEFTAILASFPESFDIITIEETWLSDSLVPLVQLEGYTFITKHKYRCKEGGGLGILKMELNMQTVKI